MSHEQPCETCGDEVCPLELQKLFAIGWEVDFNRIRDCFVWTQPANRTMELTPSPAAKKWLVELSEKRRRRIESHKAT